MALQYINLWHKNSRVTCASGLVNTSARLVFPSSFVTLMVRPAATGCFARSVIRNRVMFLLQRGLRENRIFCDRLVIAKNVRCSLDRDPEHSQFIYRKASMSSTAICIATNSLVPNVEVSTVFLSLRPTVPYSGCSVPDTVHS